VAPGPVWTPLKPADRDADAVSKFGSETPMKRPARPEEIAPAFVFLAAPSCSSYITDEILPIIGRYGAAVAQAVVDLGEKGASDGLEADDKGRIYAGDFERNSIRQRQTDGEWKTIAHDPRILWTVMPALQLAQVGEQRGDLGGKEQDATGTRHGGTERRRRPRRRGPTPGMTCSTLARRRRCRPPARTTGR
jgi:hypothetical protein